MDDQNWQWATLNNEQMTLLNEAERTLGTDYLLAFQSNDSSGVNRAGSQGNDLDVAQLNDSQLECLRGLETKLDAVVVAYQKQTV